jgi:signal transduction histidine kinase/CheY-like chemotaxis protein
MGIQRIRGFEWRGGASALAGRPPTRILGRWWLNRSVRSKGLTVVAIPMLALIAVTGSSLALQVQEQTERRVSVAANDLVLSARAVLGDVVNIEAGLQGFVATGDSGFLEPYEGARQRIQPDLIDLRRAAAVVGVAVKVDRLADAIGAELVAFERLRDGVAAGAGGPALVAGLRDAKAALDQSRVLVEDLIAGHSALIGQKREAIGGLENLIKYLQVAGLALGVLAGLAGIALFTSGISRRVRETADNAERLGRSEALTPTERSADELGRLGDSLTHAHELLATRLSDLSAARDQAQAATQLKNTFLSRTSHELRTPLNAILGFAQLLQMSELGHDDRDSTERIISAGRHLLALINELIDIARVETGDLRMSVEPVPVYSLTQDVVTLIGPLAAARGITVEHHYADRALAVYADHQRLRQVVINLASNAVKYNHHGGLVRIGYQLTEDGDRVELSITDTGPGLTPEEIQRIFVPFERLEAEQHGIEGTGIGLPLALALTQSMHGTLDVLSEPGHGSTFTLRLGRAADIDAGVPCGPDLQPVRRGGREGVADPVTVLSIEDNNANSALLARLFKNYPGTSLYAASSGYAGLELARRHPPDVILLDLHLPDLHGEEVFCRLRAEMETAKTPIVVLSADATPATIRRLLTRGAAAYLTKPLDLRELGDVLDELLTRAPATSGSQAS